MSFTTRGGQWSAHEPEHADRPTPGVDDIAIAPANWQEVLAAHRLEVDQLHRRHMELVALLEKLTMPAQEETIVINDRNNGNYVVESREKWEHPTRSVGVLNPTTVVVYFSGIGSAAPNMRSYACPAQSMIVIPIQASQLEFGCDPAALGANTAVVFLFRYFTVQPAFLGRGF